MKAAALILLLSLFIPAGIRAQYSFKQTMEEIEKLYQKNKIEDISSYYDKVSAKLEGKKNRNELFALNKSIGQFFRENNKIKQAIKYFENALKYKGDRIENEVDINLYLALCHEAYMNTDKALEYANLVIERCDEYKHCSAASIIQALNVMGLSYKLEGDILKAMSYFEKASKLATQEFGSKSLEVADLYKNLGECNDLLGSYEKALIFKEKAIKIAQNNPTPVPKKVLYFYRSLALTYQKKEDYLGAINIYNKALNVFGGIDSVQVGNIYGVIGNCYYYLERYEQAAEFFLASSSKYNDIKDDFRMLIFENLTKAGACYTNLNRFSEAAVLIDSALVYVGFDEKKTLPFEQIIGSKPSLLITLYFKAKNSFQLFLKNGCEEDLERAHQEYDLCIRLIDYIISSFDDSDSKQYLVNRFYYVFESIIEVNYQFYRLRGDRQYVDRAMRYMEKSRSILLKEMMQQSKASILAGIPDTLLSTERRLREQIATLENRRYESGRKLPVAQQNDPAFHAHNDSLFILREQYWALLKQLEKDYPAYYTMKHADRSAETAAILNRLLQPQEALVQYFVGDDHIYTLVYRADGGYFMTKAPIGTLDNDIKALRESIYNYVLTPSETLVKAYADGAYRLYEKLLQPISAHLPYRVTIIPDGLLEYLPFEALLTGKADPNSSFRAWPYCLRKYSFSYAHSVLSLEEMRQRQNRPKYRQVLAIAPSFSPALAVQSPEERRRSFGVLEDNLAEVAGIGNLFPAKTLVGTEATVESFKAQAGDYAVLHLATHAKADNEDGEYAYVAFSETKDTAHSNLLYLKNLYTMSLRADMVALSACETGVGKLRRGEGVVSLARGFSYAGANSLVTTLWRISDRESANLMQRYYQGLKNDLTKDEALRQAKITYLDEASGNRAHPFFWAAFVTIGDMEPLDLPDRGWMWGLLVGLLPVGYILWRKFSGAKGQEGKLAKGK